ncbi:unnamed protein product [Discosporangium mesarthrocarpum]
MEHNVLVWGASLFHMEGFAVGDLLGACAYPFVGLLLCKPNEVQVVERVEGTPSTTETLLQRLTGAMARFQEQLDRVTRQQRERDEARRLRQEQDDEYRRGLEEDRRRKEEQEELQRTKAREEEEARQRQQEEAVSEALREKERLERLSSLRSQIREEPPPGPEATRVRLQLPNGSKVDRRFGKDEKVGQVRSFLNIHFESAGIPITNFSMSTNFPRKTYAQGQDDGLTLVEAGLHPQSVLYVHDLDS